MRKTATILALLTAGAAQAKTLVWYSLADEPIATTSTATTVVRSNIGSFDGAVYTGYADSMKWHTKTQMPIYEPNGAQDSSVGWRASNGDSTENRTAMYFRTDNATYGKGSGGGIRVEDNEALRPSGKLTAEVIFKVEEGKSTVGENYMFLLNKPAKGLANGRAYNLYCYAKGTVGAYIVVDGVSKQLTASKAVNDGKWHHLALVIDGVDAKKALLYFDYTQASTLDLPEGYQIADSEGLPLGIGNSFQANATANYCGWIDEVRISDEALDANGFLHPFDARHASIAGDSGVILYLPFEKAPWATWFCDANDFANLAYSKAGDVYTGSGAAPSISSLVMDNIVRKMPADSAEIPNGSSALFQENGGILYAENVAAQISGSFTAELEFKMDSIPSDQKEKYLLFAYHGAEAGGTAAGTSWGVMVDKDGKLKGVYGGTLSGVAKAWVSFGSTAASVADGMWHHVAYVYNAEKSTLTLYVDQFVTGEIKDVVLFQTPHPDQKELEIGGAYKSSNRIGATIDTVRITKRALSRAEFVAHGAYVAPPTAVGAFWADFEDGLGALPYRNANMGVGASGSTGGVVPAVVAHTRPEDVSPILTNDRSLIREVNGQALSLNGGRVTYPEISALIGVKSMTVEFLLRCNHGTAGAPVIQLCRDSLKTCVWAISMGSVSGSLDIKVDTDRDDGQVISVGDAHVGSQRWVPFAVTFAAEGEGSDAKTSVKVYRRNQLINDTLLDGHLLESDHLFVAIGGAGDSSYDTSVSLDEIRISMGVVPFDDLLAYPTKGLMLLFR